MQTAHAKVNATPFSDIISALQNILARSQVIIPNLKTPYLVSPNTDHSTVESQSVLNIIAERQQQLDAVLHEISGMEAVMTDVKRLHQQLVEKKDKITQSMNLHKGLLSALWRFPNELLSQIFHHCLPDTGPQCSSLLPPSGRRAHMLLIGICRRWREVATSTPSLWCTLSVNLDVRNWERAAPCYDSWLKWSRGLPLTLVSSCFGGSDSTTLGTLLHPYKNQISSLYITFLSRDNRPELVLTDLPALEELSMHVFGNTLDFTSVQQLPSTMRKFTAVLSTGDILPSFGSLWASVTDVKISLTHSGPGSILKVLQLCPNLSSLAIRVMTRQSQTHEPLTHSTIQSLRIYYSVSSSRRFSADLFDALSLPNLRTLEACGGDGGAEWPHQEFKAFLARSQCMESLIFGRLVNMTMTDEWRAEYTTLIPSLKMGTVEEKFGDSTNMFHSGPIGR